MIPVPMKAQVWLAAGVTDILELENNTAERAVRAVVLGRKPYIFVGSQSGGKSTAIVYTLL